MNSIKTVAFTVAPIVIPKVFQWVRSVRSPAASPVGSSAPPPAIIPLSRASHRSLNIIFFSAALFAFLSLPLFAPRNIFLLTESRIQIPTDVLFNRLAELGPLTRDDLSLQSKLVSFESRLLYMMWGPSVVANCPFCNSDDFYSYLYYALPSLLLPHLVHLVLLGLATSPTFTSKTTSRFRFLALTCGLFIATYDVGIASSYNHKLNTAAFRLSDIDFFAWRRRVYLYVSLSIFDALFAGWIYKTATNRWWVKKVTRAERLEASVKALEAAHGKMQAVGIARNVVMRDERLRDRVRAYWEMQERVTKEIFEEEEGVAKEMQGAPGRIDMAGVAEEAARFAERIVGGLQGLNLGAVGMEAGQVTN